MKSIYKYILQVTDISRLTLPKGAKLLTVEAQHGNVCLWAMVDTDETAVEERTFHIYGTGHPMSDVECLHFIGTVLMYNDGLVLHIFEYKEQ